MRITTIVVLTLAAKVASAQSGALQLCDQATPRHCMTWKAPANLGASYTCTLGTTNFGPCSGTALFPIVIPSGTAAPQIDATGLNAALQITGANFINGDIVLNPGNVTGSASVLINAANLAQPALILKNRSGTTTGDIFQILDNSNAIVFKVIGATDAGAPSTVATQSIAPLGATATRDLGNSTHYWNNLYATTAYVSGNAMVGTNTPVANLSVQGAGLYTARFSSNYTDTGIMVSNTSAAGRAYSFYSSGTGSGIVPGNFSLFDELASAVRLAVTQNGRVLIGTGLDDGSTAILQNGAFSNLANVQTRKLQLEDNLGSTAFWYLHARDTSIEKYVQLIDDSGGIMMDWHRVSGGSPNSVGTIDGHFDPRSGGNWSLGVNTNWYDIKASHGYWIGTNQVIDSSRIFTGTSMNLSTLLSLNYITGTQCLQSVSGAVSGTGSPCGAGSLLSSNNTWSGNNTWNATGVFNSGLWVNGGNSGSVFLGPTEWAPSSNNVVGLGDSSHVFAQSYFQGLSVTNGVTTTTVGPSAIFSTAFVGTTGGFTNIAFGGVLTPPSGTALNGTFTCSAGLHVYTFTASQGIITAYGCN